IRSALASLLASTRDALLQIPARLAPVLAAESNPAAVHDLVQTELHQALAQLTASPDRIGFASNTDPALTQQAPAAIEAEAK
ncbi:hypothetical protein ACXWO5_10385, partial [Streptococcus pyogenes]